MHLVFERQQRSSFIGLIPFHIGNRPKFILEAKALFSEEETHILNQYNLERAAIILENSPDTFRKTFRIGIVAAIILGPVFSWFFPWQLTTVVTILSAVALAFFYYNIIREDIYVSDLLLGRRFTCLSVVDLARKEAYLQIICNYLLQVLQTAHHWAGKEEFEIAPMDPEEAKQIVIRGL